MWKKGAIILLFPRQVDVPVIVKFCCLPEEKIEKIILRRLLIAVDIYLLISIVVILSVFSPRP
jgi:hypothetical protein